MTSKPNDHSSRLKQSAALGLALMALGGCSTIASVSPFQSNVPYAANILPTVPRPENPDKPAFQKPPEPPPAPPAPAVEAPASPPAPAPQPAQPVPPTPAPPPAAAPPAPAQPAPATQPSPAPAATPAPEQQGDAEDKPPSIALEKRQFKDDGRYPNLAQTPSRPTDLPTFADAATLRKSLEADAAKASQPAAASPAAPSPQSVATDATPAKPAAPVLASAASVTPRAEDRAPCLDNAQAGSRPAASVHFAAGSAALTADGREALAEAMPTVRGSKGTIHVLGHGDAEPASDLAPPRFDLAIARAGAIAQALAGFGIPAQRIAVGVACADSALAGASVQLYTES